MSESCYFITTPIYYVNAKPHIGHAYTNILCDTFARWHRLLGENVFFLTGIDEHGSKVEKTAREQGKDPQAYVDQMVPLFKEPWRMIGISYDQFIRTTDAEHKATVQHLLRLLEEKGDIEKSSYTGWYCTPCESFWTELQLKEGKCPDCRREVQKLSEENYFFKMSKYQDWLRTYIESHPGFIQPEIRRNEILSFLKEPLADLSITRSRARLSWGIEYPGSPEHVVYVWFDALVNYISAVGYGQDSKKFQMYWPADVHVMAKDILRQHAVYWPIMLHAAGLELPEKILVHGWWTISGSKISKSVGNVVDPVELSQKYGVDTLRHYLLKEVTLGMDGAFSESLVRERYTSDLANDLGNLWFRFASMLDRYFQGALPEVKKEWLDEPLVFEVLALWEKVTGSMAAYDPRQALTAIGQVVTQANQFVEENKPWALAKDPAQKPELLKVLGILAEVMAHLAVLYLAFLPDTGKKILERMGLPTHWTLKEASDFKQSLVQPQTVIEKGEPLFPRLEDEV